jgi:hypothetical protein
LSPTRENGSKIDEELTKIEMKQMGLEIEPRPAGMATIRLLVMFGNDVR